MRTRMQRVRTILFLAAAATIALLSGSRATSAHPLDQLTQHLFVQLQPTEVRLTVAVGGGMLANELVLAQLDSNGDGAITAAEKSAWLDRWARSLNVSLDGTTLPFNSANAQLSVPPTEDFHLGVSPLLITFAAPLPVNGPAARHLIAVRNDYLVNRTTYRLDIQSASGTELIDQSWPGSSMRFAFTADPSVAVSGESTAAEAATEWSGNGVLDKARRALEHEKTPAFMFVLLGIFALMGALHAVQPGHGKTLVAAYLVATGGTPRDALALAGIVTFTHTISVFALGLATLAASELFLPSKVIPVMGAISGLLVAIMGLNMLRGALRRLRQSHNGGVFRAHADGAGHHHHANPHDHAHHEHEQLTEEEHARLHLEDALAVRHGVSRRNLIALGVSGGMAPCPDALAILLLAIGINQAGLGMLAIVAFSAGLALVLVAFGLAVALIGPAWSRARRQASTGSTRLSAALGRFATAAPMVSATIVLILGLAMTWRSIQIG
jgi:nickel/cobalt exporter